MVNEQVVMVLSKYEASLSNLSSVKAEVSH